MVHKSGVLVRQRAQPKCARLATLSLGCRSICISRLPSRYKNLCHATQCADVCACMINSSAYRGSGVLTANLRHAYIYSNPACPLLDELSDHLRRQYFLIATNTLPPFHITQYVIRDGCLPLEQKMEASGKPSATYGLLARALNNRATRTISLSFISSIPILIKILTHITHLFSTVRVRAAVGAQCAPTTPQIPTGPGSLARSTYLAFPRLIPHVLASKNIRIRFGRSMGFCCAHPVCSSVRWEQATNI